MNPSEHPATSFAVLHNTDQGPTESPANGEEQGKVKRRITSALMALSLAILAGSYLGSEGGFSSCCYNGYVDYDSSALFGIVDVHNGLLGSTHCSAAEASNSNFAGAAGRINSNGDAVHAFWFLTSHQHGQDVCDFPASAYLWGAEQAGMFVTAVNSSEYSGPVDLVFGDVERTGSTCATDLAKWPCDSQATNRDVIRGFLDYLNYLDPGSQGVYSNGPEWEAITGQATASQVGANHFWFAYWGATEAQLIFSVSALQNWGYSVASWQYTIDDACHISHSTAKARADAAFQQGYYVYRFDGWDNDQVVSFC